MSIYSWRRKGISVDRLVARLFSSLRVGIFPSHSPFSHKFETYLLTFMWQVCDKFPIDV